jgi:hypothetical protein
VQPIGECVVEVAEIVEIASSRRRGAEIASSRRRDRIVEITEIVEASRRRDRRDRRDRRGAGVVHAT